MTQKTNKMTITSSVALLAGLSLAGCAVGASAADLEDIHTGGSGGKTVEDSADTENDANNPHENISAIEVSVDGGETWQSSEGVGVFSLADILDTDKASKSQPFLSSEEMVVDGFVETYVQVRSVEGESSVIGPENVSVVYTGDAAGENHYDFYIESIDGLDVEGAVGDAGVFTATGEAVIQADGSTADFVVGVYADKHTAADVDADFEIVAVNEDEDE